MSFELVIWKCLNLHFSLSVEAIVYHGHDNGLGACRYELYLPMNEMWKEYARSLVTDCKYDSP